MARPYSQAPVNAQTLSLSLLIILGLAIVPVTAATVDAHGSLYVRGYLCNRGGSCRDALT